MFAFAGVSAAAAVPASGASVDADEREERRTRYRDLPGSEAKALGRREFARKVADRAWGLAEADRGPRVRKYLGDASALVDVPGSSRSALLQSTLPLRSRDESGDLAPLDLDVGERLGAFEPANSLVLTRIGRRAGDGLRFGGGFTVGFPGAGGAEGQVDGDKVFYADALPSTDQIVAATPQGAEVMWQLRSEESPEALSMDLGLPAKAKLRKVEIASGLEGIEAVLDGEVVMTVQPPTAFDSDNKPVPARYELDGQRLTLEVAHRGKDYLYPLLADPQYIVENWVSRNGDYYYNWNTDWNLDFTGWTTQTFWTGASGGPAFESVNGTGIGRGLWIGFDWYQTGHGEWRFKAPGDSRVFRAEFASYNSYGYGGCIQEGIKKADGWTWEDTSNGGPGQTAPSGHPCDGPAGYQIYCMRSNPCGYDGSTPGSMAIAGLWRNDPVPARWDVLVPGAQVSVADVDAPTLPHASVEENALASSNWSFEEGCGDKWTSYWADQGCWWASIKVHGEKHYSIRRRAGEGPAGYAYSDAQRKPATSGKVYAGHFFSRPEGGVTPALGRSELYFFDAQNQVVGSRIGGWAREPDAWDWARTPTVAATAPAGTTEVLFRMAWGDLRDGQWHNADAAMLEERCDGGCAARWTKKATRQVTLVGQDRSLGVNELQVTTAGATSRTDTRTHPCTGGRNFRCPATHNRAGAGWGQTIAYSTDSFREGVSSLTAKSIDIVENTSLAKALPAMKVDRTGPRIATPQGSLWDRRNQEINHTQEGLDGSSYSVTLDATDGTADTDQARRSGVDAINVQIKRPSGTVVINSPDPEPTACATDSCPGSRTYTLNTSSLADGDYVVEAKADDQLGNVSAVTSWEITVNKRDACPGMQVVSTTPSPGVGSGTPNGNAVTETPTPVAAPDVTRDPVFDRFFNAKAPDGFAPSSDSKCHVAAAASDTQLLVSSERNSNVEVMDVKTLAPIRTLEGVEGARGVAAYRGEGYVADRANRIFVFDPATGTFKRRFDHPTSLLIGTESALRQIAVTGLDVAWGEIWATFQTAAGRGVTVMDSATGLPKSVFFQMPAYDCTSNPLALPISNASACTSTTGLAASCATNVTTSGGSLRVDPTGCTAKVAPSTIAGAPRWWDVATVPELGGTVAGCRFLRRSPLLTAASAPDAVTPLSSAGWQQCADSQYQDGIDAVWGMEWLLSVAGISATAPGKHINDYALNAPGGTAPVFDGPKRTWTPQDVAVTNHRDVAYRNRELRVDWTGDLTRTTWQRGRRCATYTVTDADAFVIGRRGERWYELARGFQRIKLEINGTERSAATGPSGELCLDLDSIPSGTYTARLTATADAGQGAKTAAIANSALRIDHDVPAVTPSGEWWEPRDDVVNGQGTHSVRTNGRDTHSGIRQLSFEHIDHPASKSQDAPCSGTQCPLESAAAFIVDARDLAEGEHTYRVSTIDLVGNPVYSPPWTIAVDRTAPSFSDAFQVAAEYSAETGRGLLDWDTAEDPLLADGTEGSGVETYQFRFETAGGAWSEWATVDATWAWVDGVLPGQEVNVEVRAFDAVRNASSLATAAGLVKTVSDPDASTSPPSDFSDDPSLSASGLPVIEPDGDSEFQRAPAGTYVSAGEEEAGELVEDEPELAPTTGGDTLPRVGTVPARYRIRLRANIDGTPRWATVRNKAQALVIGNARNKAVFDVKRLGGGRPGARMPSSYFGRLYEHLEACGWVFTGNAKESSAATVRGSCGSSSLSPKSFARLINCDRCNLGTGVRLRVGTDSTGAPMPATVPLYRNVRPFAIEKGRDRVADLATTVRIDGKRVGTNFGFRYLTKGGRFVMGTAPELRGKGSAWFFIEAKYMPTGDDLCEGKVPKPPISDKHAADWPNVCEIGVPPKRDRRRKD